MTGWTKAWIVFAVLSLVMMGAKAAVGDWGGAFDRFVLAVLYALLAIYRSEIDAGREYRRDLGDRS